MSNYLLGLIPPKVKTFALEHPLGMTGAIVALVLCIVIFGCGGKTPDQVSQASPPPQVVQPAPTVAAPSPVVVVQQPAATAAAPSNDGFLQGALMGGLLGHALGSSNGGGGGGGSASTTHNTTVVNRTIVNKTYVAPPPTPAPARTYVAPPVRTYSAPTPSRSYSSAATYRGVRR